jgi:hypothetical protein
VKKTHPSLLVALLLVTAVATLAAPPVLAEEVTAPAVAAVTAECAAPTASAAPAEAADELFLAGTPCGPVTCSGNKICCDASCGICGRAGGPCPDVPACVSGPAAGPQPLFLDHGPGGGEPCNRRHCGAGQFCCNFSCSICAPEGGFCTQQLCE